MSAPIPEDILGGMYAAFNARDIDGVIAALHPDVDWPNGWEGGRMTGVAAVRDYWLRQWAAINPSVTPQAFHHTPAGDVVATVRQTIKGLDGAVLSDSTVDHTYRFRDGLVAWMDIKAT